VVNVVAGVATYAVVTVVVGCVVDAIVAGAVDVVVVVARVVVRCAGSITVCVMHLCRHLYIHNDVLYC